MLQIYTGNGKGKTTAALGLALRAVGANLRVSFIQFMKNLPTSELESIKLLGDKIVIKRFGTGEYIINTPKEKDFECALVAFAQLERDVMSAEFALVIADELCTALYYNLIDKNCVLDLIKSCPQNVELVFTGRYAADDIINAADIVTEMREIKHCYETAAQCGTVARRGFDC